MYLHDLNVFCDVAVAFGACRTRYQGGTCTAMEAQFSTNKWVTDPRTKLRQFKIGKEPFLAHADILDAAGRVVLKVGQLLHSGTVYEAKAGKRCVLCASLACGLLMYMGLKHISVTKLRSSCFTWCTTSPSSNLGPCASLPPGNNSFCLRKMHWPASSRRRARRGSGALWHRLMDLWQKQARPEAC